MSDDGVETQLVRPPTGLDVAADVLQRLSDAEERAANLSREVGRLLGEVADLEAQNFHLQCEVDALR